MTTFLLIRHAAHALGSGIIAGRTPGVGLSAEGERQSAELADRLAGVRLAALYTSPMERTRKTAALLGERIGLVPVESEALTEIDFGRWSGRAIDELRSLEAWRLWNTFRSGTPIPGGELMLAAQSRIVAEVLRLARDHGENVVGLVSHGDLIRAAVAYFLGIPLDLFLRIEISLASVSVVQVLPTGPRVLCINNTGAIVTS